MNIRRYSKILAGLVAGLTLLSMMITSARADAGDTMRVSVAHDKCDG